MRVMRKPDSPLKAAARGGLMEKGRSAQEKELGAAGVGTARGQKAWPPPPSPRRDPAEPGTQEHHRSQAAGGELGRAEDPGLPGLSWLGCHQAWGGKGFSTLVP